MGMVNLKLTTENGKVLEFKKNRVTARWIKEGFKLQKKLVSLEKKEDYEALLDVRIAFMVDFFDDEKLTADVVLDNLENDELIPTLDRLFNQIMGLKSDDPPGELSRPMTR